MSGDTECEIKIGDVDSATTGNFVSIKPYNEQVEFGDMDLTRQEISNIKVISTPR